MSVLQLKDWPPVDLQPQSLSLQPLPKDSVAQPAAMHVQHGR